VQDHGTEADEEVNKILFQALKSYYSADLTYDKFVNSYGKKFGIVQASKVGPTVAEDIKTMHIGRFLELC
jgi:SecD/SecF fusion protein